MKVLTVVYDLGPGGTQRVAQNYAAGYAKAGLESAVLAYEGGGPRTAALRERGIELFVGDPEKEGPDLDAVDRAASWGPDVVHVHREGDPNPRIGAVLYQLRQALPAASMVETNVFSRADTTGTGRMFDLHLQLSTWCLWKWSRWTRYIRPEPVGIVLPNVVDSDAFRPAPEAAAAFRAGLGVPVDAVLFGRIGQPVAAKWMPLLFSSFAAVAEQEPRAHLLVVGLPDELRDDLSRMPGDIRRRVHVVSFLQGDEALRAAYSAIDVFAHAATKGESFGMVLVESMLCETPVVTLSRVAHDNTQVEVVGHGVGGLVAADAAGFTEALVMLARDADLRSRLGRGGAARVRARYDADVVLPKLVRAIEAVRAAPSRSALRARLRELGFATSVSPADVRSLAATGLGRTPVRERVLSTLVHQPALYRLWRRIRG